MGGSGRQCTTPAVPSLVESQEGEYRCRLPNGARPETANAARAQRVIAGFEAYEPEPRSSGAAMRLRRVNVDAHEIVLDAGDGVAIELTAPADGAFVRPVLDAKGGDLLALPQTVELRRDGLTFAVFVGPPASGHR